MEPHFQGAGNRAGDNQSAAGRAVCSRAVCTRAADSPGAGSRGAGSQPMRLVALADAVSAVGSLFPQKVDACGQSAGRATLLAELCHGRYVIVTKHGHAVCISHVAMRTKICRLRGSRRAAACPIGPARLVRGILVDNPDANPAGLAIEG